MREATSLKKKTLNEPQPGVDGAHQQPAKVETPRTAAAGEAKPGVPPGARSGQVLPVVERPQAAAAPRPVQAASPVVGVPVRLQPEPLREQQAASAAATLVPTPEGDFWHATVQQLVAQEAIAALVRELALQSQLVARDEGHWMLRVERESLNQPSSRERLRGALHAAGHVVDLSVEVGPITDSPARRNAQAAAQRQSAAEQVILNDPFVQSMMRDFGAKIVPGSIKPRTEQAKE
jgi:DNA polymerase-3 subunit gamma/tau